MNGRGSNNDLTKRNDDKLEMSLEISMIESNDFSIRSVGKLEMATISKESFSDFWLKILSQSAGRNFVETTEKKEEKRRTKRLFEKNSNLKFSINVETEKFVEPEKNEICSSEICSENFASILSKSDRSSVKKDLEKIVRFSFGEIDSSENFSRLADLMNKFFEEFREICFLVWLRDSSTSESSVRFLTKLFDRIENPSDRNRICLDLSADSTAILTENQIQIVARWLNDELFFFDPKFFLFFVQKLRNSAETFGENLFFAKLIHQILIRIDENHFQLDDQQRLALKQTILCNSTSLKEILLDFVQ